MSPELGELFGDLVEVRKEINETVAEIERLRDRLVKLQADKTAILAEMQTLDLPKETF